MTFSSLGQNSKKILDSLKHDEHKEALENKLDEINQKWESIIIKSMEIKSKLETNKTAECDTILKSLDDLKDWCNQKINEIDAMRLKFQPEPNLILKLIEEINVIIGKIIRKKNFF